VNDYCLYILGYNDEVIYLIIFVDALLICGKNKGRFKDIKDKLSDKFKMEDLGEVRTYLGIDIKHDRNKNEIAVDQREYIESLSRKYDIIYSKGHHSTVREK